MNLPLRTLITELTFLMDRPNLVGAYDRNRIINEAIEHLEDYSCYIEPDNLILDTQEISSNPGSVYHMNV